MLIITLFSVALQIHCSHQCKQLLGKLGGYTIVERGFVSMKVSNILSNHSTLDGVCIFLFTLFVECGDTLSSNNIPFVVTSDTFCPSLTFQSYSRQYCPVGISSYKHVLDFNKSRLIGDWFVVNINPDMTPNGMLLDISVSPNNN